MSAPPIKTAIGVSLVIALTIGLHMLGALQSLESFTRRGVNALSGWIYRGATTIQHQEAASDTRACEPTDEGMMTQTLLKEENDALRKQLGFVERQRTRAVGADVIGRDVEPIGNTLLINRGKREGLLKGQAVIVEDGILIGKIVRVEDDIAIVQLLSDGQSKIAATIMNHDRSIGIVEGGYGLSVRMNFIPQNEAIVPGDVIITSGLEEGIPKGLIIGVIEVVEREAYQPFQRAVLSTRAKLDRITFVSVLLSDSDAAL